MIDIENVNFKVDKSKNIIVSGGIFKMTVTFDKFLNFAQNKIMNVFKERFREEYVIVPKKAMDHYEKLLLKKGT